jgi:hypothetical protein
MHNAGCSMQLLLLERRSESDGFMESEALKIADMLMRLIAEIDEIDLGKEWIASSRHSRLPKAPATCFNQGMDKSCDGAQLKIRDESLKSPMTPIRGTGDVEIDLNLARQPSLTGCRELFEEKFRKPTENRLVLGRFI